MSVPIITTPVGGPRSVDKLDERGVTSMAKREKQYQSVSRSCSSGGGHVDKSISLVVDGNAVTVNADPQMPLLYALRSELGLNNPKFGCGKAQCGACTVHLDGAPVRSCVLPVEAAAGRRVTTLSGLGTADKPHPLQTAYIQEQVPQCGYCLSGWIMTAAAFLKTNPKPSDAQIREAMAGIKCRCGTHMAIMRAIKRASQTTSA
jgi:nicotinate dehydrogenase subunit A